MVSSAGSSSLFTAVMMTESSPCLANAYWRLVSSEFLVTARVKRLLPPVNLSQLCNQVCKFAVKFTFLLYGDGGTQRFIAGVGALSLNAPFAAVIDGWNSAE
mgnify:CR=1 FL=1